MAALAAATPSNGTVLRQLQEVERELHSPNGKFYQILSAPDDSEMFDDTIRRIASFPANTALFTMYERVQCEWTTLKMRVQHLSERVMDPNLGNLSSITVQGQVYSTSMSMYDAIAACGAQVNFVKSRFQLLKTHVEGLLATRDRLRASLGTAAVTPAALPAATPSAQKTPD